ncbi:MAG: sigma-E factor negative regulatory protein [Betaproteobacteria bacterium]
MREEISRLVDGDLPEDHLAAACSELKQGEGMATWMCYHVIGETLRGTAGAAPRLSEKFAARLAAEPVVVAPRARVHRPLTYAWAAAATIAAVAVTGWAAFSVIDTAPAATAVAKARETTAVRAALGRPATVPQDYLLAHQEFSPSSQIQGPGPSIRAMATPAFDARP